MIWVPIMNLMPIPENFQLNNELWFHSTQGSAALCRIDRAKKTLPGQPRVHLESSELIEYLEKDLLLPQLDHLAPHLWLVQ